MVVSILAVIVLVVAIVGAVKHRPESIRLAYRAVAPLPLFFVFASAVVSAASAAASRLSAADAFWFRAAADQVCYGNAASLSLPNENSFECGDPDEIGPPREDSTGGGWTSNWCNAEASISMSIASRFVYTLIFNVALLSYLTFNLWSFYKAVSRQPPGRQGPSDRHGAARGTQLQPMEPAIGQPITIATAVAAPVSGEAGATALSSPGVIVATPGQVVVATPGVTIATAVGTPAIAVGTPTFAAPADRVS